MGGLLFAIGTGSGAAEFAPPEYPPIELTVADSNANSDQNNDVDRSTQVLVDYQPPITPIDLTTPPRDLWERIRVGFAMPSLNSNLVSGHQASYLNRPEYLKRIIERSRRYLFHIVQEIEARGMPTELALLPIVESAFNPMALSHANASGIWQFIPSTGRSFNLQQNWWIDQRRDIVDSTSAALDYLQALYERHGDWHLALASYNWGEGAVARAIGRNQASGLDTDYLSLSMPAETRNYVPKLQALKNIIAQPYFFGIGLDPIPNRAYFKTVAKPADMDVAVAARLAEMEPADFIALNPAYKRPVMPQHAKTSIVLPIDKVETFQRNLEAHDEPLANWRTYTLKRGERLNHVARRFGLSIASLKQINGLGARARPRVGHRLIVPVGDVLSESDVLEAADEARPAARVASRIRAKGTAHTAKKAHQAKRGQVQSSRSKAGQRAAKSAGAKRGKKSNVATRPAKTPISSVGLKRDGSGS